MSAQCPFPRWLFGARLRERTAALDLDPVARLEPEADAVGEHPARGGPTIASPR